MSVPCEVCTAKCCKNYDVFIDHEDIKRLNNIDSFKIIEYQKSFGYVPKFYLFKGDKKNRYVICLNNTNQVCNFLKNDRCSIYQERPLICKTYPHFVDKDKVKEMKNLCPIKWNLGKSEIDLLRQNYDKLLVNFLAMETICDVWNKIVTKKDNLQTFIDFVKKYEFT
jgi:Fe-S-cluster containining protein